LPFFFEKHQNVQSRTLHRRTKPGDGCPQAAMNGTIETLPGTRVSAG
jgi:hypothetical protein